MGALDTPLGPRCALFEGDFSPARSGSEWRPWPANGAMPLLIFAWKLLGSGFSPLADSVKDVLRRAGKEGKSVGDSPNYGSLAARVPAQVNGLTYGTGWSFQSTLQFVFGADGEGKTPDLSWAGEMFSGSIGYLLWKDTGLYCRSDIVLKKGAGSVRKSE
jgi:hypothetical protein